VLVVDDESVRRVAARALGAGVPGVQAGSDEALSLVSQDPLADVPDRRDDAG
jgi:hypothetical protein